MKYKFDLIHISMMHYSSNCLDSKRYFGLAEKVKEKFEATEPKDYTKVTPNDLPGCEMDLQPNEIEALYLAACVKMGIVQERSRCEHTDIMEGTERNLMYLCIELSRIRRSSYRLNPADVNNISLN